MELRHLRYFLAVVEHGTITAAAAELRVAQPAISRQLQSLESQLGVRLFTRNGPRLRLTHAGREMHARAEDLVTRSRRFEDAAHALASGELTEVSLAAADTTISEVVAPFVATLGTTDPFVSVRLSYPDGIHSLVHRDFDLGVSAASPPTSGLDWVPLTDVPLRAYTSTGHPWAVSGQRHVPVGDLVAEKLIVPGVNHPVRKVLDDAAGASGHRFQAGYEVPSPRMVQALSAAGRGVGIATDLPRFGAYPIFVVTDDGEPVVISIHACWHPDHYAAEAIRRFVARLAEFCSTTVREAAWT
jgi:DNA-binding transcriptional LysR family regulator